MSLPSLVRLQFVSALYYPFLGVSKQHHGASHYGTEEDYQKMVYFEVGQLAYLAQRLAAMPDGKSTVSDNSCLLFPSNMRSGTKHDNKKAPVVTISGLGGKLKSGGALNYFEAGDDNRKLCSLYLSTMDRMGVELAEFGDAKTRLAGFGENRRPHLRCYPSRAIMKRQTLALSSAIALATGLAAQPVQPEKDAAVAVHIEAARKAAGKEHTGIFEGICTQFAQPAAIRPPAPARRPGRAGPPDRATWHAEPVKVFDNLYFVGEKDYGAWAVTTSEGIIIIDTNFDYSVEDEIVNGLKKLGLNPATIKYVIVSHAHRDHVGGAGYLQEHFGARVVMAAEDWGLLERTDLSFMKARRDMVATDGQKLTLGDTTITMYVTPGHTLGTLSLLVPVKDNGKPHLAASWGGTGFNWLSGSPIYITPDRPNKFWFDTYINSAARFRDIAAKAGADVLIANHTHLDDAKNKLPAMAKRRPSDPHPYVIGNDAVVRYVTVASECAKAGLARTQ